MSITRHTSYNLIGSLIPMLVGIIAVPKYLHLIGDARYGVLAIVWLFLGYFGLFDPGITRAASYHIARLGGDDQSKERESVFWTALVVNMAFGIVGGLVLYAAARPLFMTYFKMPENMRGEVMAALPWLAASIPVSIFTTILGGALQARERFGAYNIIYVLNSCLAQLAPLAVAYFHGPDLTWLIPAVLLSRAAGAIPSFLVLSKAMPLRIGGRYDSTKLKPLFSYGGWITISNLINPIMDSLDRMLIGTVLGAESVTYYTVPSNFVGRLTILPGSLVTSIFPRLSRAKEEHSSQLAGDAVVMLNAIMTPITIIAIGSLTIFMKVWVKQIAAHAAPIGIVLLVGVWVNCLAFIPAAHLNAINRPDLPAKFHAYEVVPYLVVLWSGLHFFGLIGAAFAWALRATVDAVLLFVVAGQTPGWSSILPSSILVLLAALFAPKTPLSLGTPVELVLLALSLLLSWRSSPMLQSVIRSRLKVGASI